MKFTYILFILACLSINSFASKPHVAYTDKDYRSYQDYVSQFKTKSQLPLNKLLIETALYFKNKPYVGSTLDKNTAEEVTVNLNEFDCTTFVETCIALSRMIKSEDNSFDNFATQLESIRYRGGVASDYSSRLHYVTDWIYDNQKQGMLKNVSLSLNGIQDPKAINFMSTHKDKYPQLKNDLEQTNKIRQIETAINKRNNYIYIPKQEVGKIENLIKDGDIIVFATSISGLDYSHIGIAYHVADELRFIHASTNSMKVIIEPQSLSDYCLKSKRCVGVTILRLND